MPKDQVVINPKCVAVEVSVRQDVGVKSSVATPARASCRSRSVVGQYVEVRNRQGSKVTIGTCDDTDLRFFTFGNHDDHVAKAQLSIDATSFSGLSSLNALIFDNINLEKPQLQVTIPTGLARLEVISTNVLGLSLRVARQRSAEHLHIQLSRHGADGAARRFLRASVQGTNSRSNYLKISPLDDVQARSTRRSTPMLSPTSTRRCSRSRPTSTSAATAATRSRHHQADSFVCR
ncbi:hypothetical protein PINS_up023925 [Pythium insidiosum]|nr:hypothetical protein PINS_up023925 [Pythium insidiosum]